MTFVSHAGLNMSKQNVVYMVSFPNGKKYIGITCRNFEIRKKEHLSKAQKGSKLKFHRALLKYKNAADWRVLNICDTYEQAKLLEIKYIDEFNTQKFGYNLTNGGDGTSGYKASEDHRRKLSKAHAGVKLSTKHSEAIRQSLKGIHHKDRKSFVSVDLTTGVSVIYEDLEAVVKAGFSKSCVIRVCNGERRSHKGYAWKFLKD